MPTSPWLEVPLQDVVPRPPRGVRMKFKTLLLFPHQCSRLAPPPVSFPHASLSLTSPACPPPPTGGPWQGGTPPDCELLRGKGCADGIPVTSGAGALQASHHARRINSRRCPLPARCCSGFPTCRRLQRPDVLGPEGAVGLLQALSTGEQGTELLVALSTGMGDKVRPEGCKFRCFP